MRVNYVFVFILIRNEQYGTISLFLISSTGNFFLKFFNELTFREINTLKQTYITKKINVPVHKRFHPSKLQNLISIMSRTDAIYYT